jgi:hypothetical protein
MNYPLISEYIEAIKAAEENFEELKHLRPVLGDDGEPVMTSGNFAVVFKMKDINDGKFSECKVTDILGLGGFSIDAKKVHFYPKKGVKMHHRGQI